MRAAADRAGFPIDIDSAGTGDWHVGRPPDPRAIGTGRRHGVDIAGLRGRQVKAVDFDHFDRVIALDKANFDDLRRLAPASSRAEISMLLDHAQAAPARMSPTPISARTRGSRLPGTTSSQAWTGYSLR